MKWTNSSKDTLPKFTQEVDYLNRPIPIKEIESIINYFIKQKALGPDGFTDEFYQTLGLEIMLIFYNLFQKIEAEIKLPNSFYEASIT